MHRIIFFGSAGLTVLGAFVLIAGIYETIVVDAREGLFTFLIGLCAVVTGVLNYLTARMRGDDY